MEPINVVEGPVTVIDQEDVDTDQIIPARFMKRVERTGFGEYCFHEWRANGYDLPANPILVAGANFGCGSSREHAPWALMDYGFRALISPNFADIFKNNCTKNGVLPIELPKEQCDEIVRRGSAKVDLEAQTVDEFPFEIDPEIKRRLLGGLDDISITLQSEDRIAAYEAARERSGPDTTKV
ncbi:3-isopropylmalate dehydratase small subunit [Paraconexibacter algicola]|uniref:3-isopropylmalate dehydratase small subunit n=1 Tax=Paraconexibacter algicola TaxID=2133960 RepID=A0A2T4UBC1_9ACTN|nr:3-isopropylmalate dehydratase small subunit [Paraconexibacter algicola]PTL54166.1 3-isopropylmalate dehydratase small subunit [Paraconexibacter algicola]